MHQVEAGVDLLQRHCVGDQIVYVDLTFHVPVHDLGHVGASPRAAEGAAFPHPACHKLERARGDLLPRPGHPDDHRDAPAPVGALQGLAHNVHVADALEGVVCPAAGQVDEIRHEVALHLVRVDEVGHAEFLGEVPLGGVDVDADDLVGPHHLRTLDHVQAYAPEAEDHDVRAGLDSRGVDHRADAGRYAAADVADLMSSRIFATAISGRTA